MSVKADLKFNHFTIGHLRIDPLKFWGSGGTDFSQLYLPLEILLRPIEIDERDKNTNEKLYRHFTLINLWIDMYFCPASLETFISQTITRPILDRSKDWDSQLQLSLPISMASLNHIEKNRYGDIELKFRFEYFFASHPKRAREAINVPDPRILDFYSNNSDMRVSIPKSHWVEKILPSLGWGEINLLKSRHLNKLSQKFTKRH